MKTYEGLMEIPAMHFTAAGWTKDYFDRMINGLIGHLDGLFYPFNTGCWKHKSFQDGGLEGWWPYEQNAYWTDGLLKAAWYSGHTETFEKMKAYVDDALTVADSDGFVGAVDLKKKNEGNQWVHAVFFRAVLFLYRTTGDDKYLQAVIGHYTSGTCDYDTLREAVNIENMAVAYLLSGDTRMKDLALSCYQAYCANPINEETRPVDLLKDTPIDLHGVTYNELAKLPALIYALTGDPDDLRAAVSGYERIHNHHELVTGMHSCCENFKGTGGLDSLETCDISDTTWSLGYLGKVTGDTAYFDRIERIVYNVAPSVSDEDFRGIQYFSSCNQVISTSYSNHSGSFTQTPRMAYQPDHYPECCTGNVSRAVANFVHRSVMAAGDTLSFVFYLPGKLALELNGQSLAFEIITDYPYDDRIQIVYRGPATTQAIALRFRIPGWCQAPELKFNGKDLTVEKGWAATAVALKQKDTFTLRFPSEMEQLRCDEGFYIQKQPLVYTLAIDYHKEADPWEKRQTADYPAWNVLPASPWQIALDAAFIRNAVYHPAKSCGSLLATEDTPVIEGKGWLMEGVDLRRIDAADLPISDYDRTELVKLQAMGQNVYQGEMALTPAISTLDPTGFSPVDIRLVPYSTAMLRWTVFPDKTAFK